MEEIDLLQRPKIKRNFDPNWRKEENRIIARKFDKEFFDGERINGYGGYKYDGRWVEVVERLKNIYNLNGTNSFLDVGCAKGFLLYDLKKVIPGIEIYGLDVSNYAVENCIEGVKENLVVGSADELPYETNSFDFVFSSDTLHNLPRDKCKKALQEIVRVCKPSGNMFIQVDSYRNKKEKNNLISWNLTALTYMHVDEWLKFFKESGYNGDYFWTILD